MKDRNLKRPYGDWPLMDESSNGDEQKGRESGIRVRGDSGSPLKGRTGNDCVIIMGLSVLSRTYQGYREPGSSTG
jgi:hypothetical protein